MPTSPYCDSAPWVGSSRHVGARSRRGRLLFPMCDSASRDNAALFTQRVRTEGLVGTPTCACLHERGNGRTDHGWNSCCFYGAHRGGSGRASCCRLPSRVSGVCALRAGPTAHAHLASLYVYYTPSQGSANRSASEGSWAPWPPRVGPLFNTPPLNSPPHPYSPQH